ncbi:Spo0E like sporulation regulatory protein [Oxobacter pfennigii]|uniref:Spo0E like sporulation regulatory protein n=1 Tax=Oxobacter pfennigii TaxID=36849 RepID=A0A0P9AES5_9CLOT|nr:aspartyl-phosphate phosphatase Spo0E family protein [Oxobacter pfennigii]KPU43818.1 Spo0E like sporulation regulatory protein [Oxobacter pfennigii]
MRLIDEIKKLQEELNRIIIENEQNKKQILEFSRELDTLIASYYADDNRDKV